ncbi:unnamed protein product [Ectocarpus sp. CCAP 1310/34]|nr:unnamed protein product [Ectocarpus sp. CCAP 1310/34]
MEPTEYPLSEKDILFSKRLESVRKDVECFFGILKGRFRILKLAMAYPEQERIDNVFFTCCILHNMLHTFDGMDQVMGNTHWVSSAGAGTGVATEQEADSSSVGAKDTNEREGHGERKRKLNTSFAYRKKHKKDIVWLSRRSTPVYCRALHSVNVASHLVLHKPLQHGRTCAAFG